MTTYYVRESFLRGGRGKDRNLYAHYMRPYTSLVKARARSIALQDNKVKGKSTGPYIYLDPEGNKIAGAVTWNMYWENPKFRYKGTSEWYWSGNNGRKGLFTNGKLKKW